MIPEQLRALAPFDLPVRRSERYSGGALGVPLDCLAPADRAILRRVYDAVLAVAAARPEVTGGPADDPPFVARVRAVAAESFTQIAQALGDATVRNDAPPLVRKVLHDIRGGALTALVGTAGLLDLGPPDPGLLVTCGRLARDHCKIVRSAVSDLDPARRAHDEQCNYHGIATFVRTWGGATVREYGRDVTVAVRCTYNGGVAASCLEHAAVDRVLYNHVNNAARFTSDGRVTLSVFGVGPHLIRWVVSNAVAPGQRAWLSESVGPDLGRLYAGGVTSGGSGIGLASCGDFVAAAFGLSSAADAVTGGYLGARVVGNEYHAWFHWPAYLPAGRVADPITGEPSHARGEA